MYDLDAPFQRQCDADARYHASRRCECGARPSEDQNCGACERCCRAEHRDCHWIGEPACAGCGERALGDERLDANGVCVACLEANSGPFESVAEMRARRERKAAA